MLGAAGQRVKLVWIFFFSPAFTALLFSLQCDYMSEQLDY